MSGNRKDLESAFQTEVIDKIERMGGYVLKTHVSSFQKQGEPDVTVCFKGRYVAFELKVGDNQPTKLQLLRLKEIRRAGGIAMVVRQISQVEETLNEISRHQHGDESQ